MYDSETEVKQRGAAEARRAHNPEDAGSKPAVAKFFFDFLFSGKDSKENLKRGRYCGTASV